MSKRCFLSCIIVVLVGSLCRAQSNPQPTVKPQASSESIQTNSVSPTPSTSVAEPAPAAADAEVSQNTPAPPPLTPSLSQQRRWAIRQRFALPGKQAAQKTVVEKSPLVSATQSQQPAALPNPQTVSSAITQAATTTAAANREDNNVSRSVYTATSRQNVTMPRQGLYQQVQYAPNTGRSQGSGGYNRMGAADRRSGNAGYGNRSSGGARQNSRMGGQTGRGGYGGGGGNGGYEDRQYRAERLIGIIRSTVAPDSWADTQQNAAIQRNRQ